MASKHGLLRIGLADIQNGADARWPVTSRGSFGLHVSSHPQFNEWQADILRQDSTLVADVRFAADPENWAGRGSIHPNCVSPIDVGIERYTWFVDILRNEKPLFAVLSNPASGAVPPRLL
jgi:hypothetical protein